MLAGVNYRLFINHVTGASLVPETEIMHWHMDRFFRLSSREPISLVSRLRIVDPFPVWLMIKSSKLYNWCPFFLRTKQKK